MKSIVLGTISLDGMAGGLEKNIVLLANHFATLGNNVHLITFDRICAVSFYEIHQSVKWHKVGTTKPHTPVGFVERIKLISRIRSVILSINNPIVICFHHGILLRFFLAKIALGLKLVCSERNSISLYQHIRQRKWSVGFILLGLTTRITVQFHDYIRSYPVWVRKRIRVIHNPVDIPPVRAFPDMPASTGRYKLITVGRLCAQKNQKVLIDVFNRLKDKHLLWDLHIIGDGEILEDLSKLIKELSLSERVFLEGKHSNISSWLREGNIFCFPSKWEGFPNALAEAMAHGLPCVGFSDCAGVRDLIVDGETGFLVAQDELWNALDQLMLSPIIRKRMGTESINAISQYSPESSFQKWEKLLEQVVSHP